MENRTFQTLVVVPMVVRLHFLRHLVAKVQSSVLNTCQYVSRSPETWWRVRTRAETDDRSQQRPRRCPWCRSARGADRQTVRPSPNQRHVASGSPASQSPRYLVVVGAEVLEVAKADVGQTHHDGDDQHHQGEQRGRRLKPCSGKRLASLALASQLLSPSDFQRSCSSSLSSFSSSSFFASKRSWCTRMPRRCTAVLHGGVHMLFTSCSCVLLSQPLAAAAAAVLKEVVQKRPAASD